MKSSLYLLMKVLSVFAVILITCPVQANVPLLINYQGYLTDSSDKPLSGNQLVKFFLYNVDEGGTGLWSEQQTVMVVNGVFNVQIGAVSPLDPTDFESPDVYLEIAIFNSGKGWETLAPRQRLTSVAFTMHADMVDGKHASAFAEATHDHAGEVWIANVAWSNGAFKVLNYSNGPSIWGWNGGNGNGVRGYATGSGIGVYGESQNNAGVVGRSTNGNGLEGYGGGSAYAGYFSGDVQITGNLIKGGGSFKIDHPLDPENKYLQHSFVESPDMMNVYNGNVILDDRGETWVKLPEYFEALNSDFRYQLTAIGAPGPNLYVAEKIFDGQFKIAGGQSGMEVSWQVTGIRQDAWAEANRIEVEVDKDETEQGYYLYPGALGLDETCNVHYIHNQEKFQEEMDMEMEHPVIQD